MDEELKVKVTIDAESANKSIDKLNEGLDKVNQKIDSTNKKSLNGLQKATINTSGLGLEQLKSVKESLKASNIDASVLEDIDSQIGNISSKMDDNSDKKESSSPSEKGGDIKWGKIAGALFGVKEVLDIVKKLFHDNANMQAALDNLFTTLGSILAPIIDFIAKVVNTIAAILSNLFKINRKTSVSTGAMAKSLAGFDELNNIGSSSGGGAGGAVAADPGVFQGIVDFFSKWGPIILAVIAMIAAAVAVATGVISATVGIVLALIALIVIFWDDIKAAFISFYEIVVKAIIDAVVELVREIVEIFVAVWNLIKTVFEWLITSASKIWDWLKNLFSNMGVWISDAWTKFKSFIADIWTTFKNHWTGVWQNIKDSAVNIVNNIKNAWEGVKTTVGSFLSSLGQKIKDVVWNNGLRKVIQSLANGVVNLVNKIPLVSVGYPTIPYLANGGMVSGGQLFVANEAGPELVGKFGHTTGVMNNDQIVEAVANGVYNAVIDASKENNQEIILTMDGIKLAKSVVKNINMMNRIAGGSVIG